MMVLLSLNGKAQRLDFINFFSQASLGLGHYKIQGVQLVNDGYVYDDNNDEYKYEPRYDKRDTIGYSLKIFGFVGTDITCLTIKNTSFGVRLSLGVGAQTSLKAAKGLESYGFEVPAYLYVRNQGEKLDLSFLVGYKYSLLAVKSHLLMVGLEYGLNDGLLIGLYGSLLPYKYYTFYTNGVYEPALIIREINLGLTQYF